MIEELAQVYRNMKTARDEDVFTTDYADRELQRRLKVVRSGRCIIKA